MSASRSFLLTEGSVSAATEYTWNGKTLGDAAADRLIALWIMARGNTATTTLSAVTIGGVSATLSAVDFQADGTQNAIGGWAVAAVPTGTTGDFVVTFSGAVARMGYAAYRLVGASATLSDTATSKGLALTVYSDTINAPADGVVLSGVSATSSSTRTFTWAGVDEDVDSMVGPFSAISAASRAFASTASGHAVSATASGGTAFGVMGTIAFAPVGGGPTPSVGLIGRGLVGNNPLISVGRGGLIS